MFYVFALVDARGKEGLVAIVDETGELKGAELMVLA